SLTALLEGEARCGQVVGRETSGGPSCPRESLPLREVAGLRACPRPREPSRSSSPSAGKATTDGSEFTVAAVAAGVEVAAAAGEGAGGTLRGLATRGVEVGGTLKGEVHRMEPPREAVGMEAGTAGEGVPVT
ncbi:unnamed protein product, partial [Ectocarpus sp. 13 AM-2016]